MNTPITYTVDRIADVLKIPIERRSAFFRELEYALALHELAFGEDSPSIEIGPLRWTDDADKSVALHDAAGEILRLNVDTEEQT